MSDLYKHPEQYDREHLADEEDIGFYVSLGRKLCPRKLLDLGCGTGRTTLPLAQIGFDVVGLETVWGGALRSEIWGVETPNGRPGDRSKRSE